MSDATVDELVEEIKKPGTFSIMSVLKERLYPTDTVLVRLDEDSAYKASEIQEKITELESADADSGFSLGKVEQKELDTLIASRDELVKKIEKSTYTFTLTGIAEGKREDFLNKCNEQFPVEFNEDKNTFTGEVTRTEKENKGRDRLFTNFLWEAHILKIVAPDGSEQNSFTHADIIELRESLPLVSIGSITQGIEKIRMATAIFMFKVDEDFLAKS
tara:strand:+ start:4106 stop:4756 length:651 start_codon:yes stop_codon:yes gene_type:complete